jgi:DNA-binding transcriptional MerR regulator
MKDISHLPVYRISEVVRQVGYSSRTIKNLEKSGLIDIPARDVNGHRRYSQDQIDHIRKILIKDK